MSKGRIDLILVDKEYAKFTLAQPKLMKIVEKVKPIDEVLESREQFVIISKKAKNAVLKLVTFNKGLAKLNEKGQVSDILKRHGLSLDDIE